MNNDPTFEEIEAAIPESRKKMDFGGKGIIGVMEEAERNAHERGQHPENAHPTCPVCAEENDGR